MGNCGEKPSKIPLNVQLAEMYKAAGLPELDQTVLNSELEKEVFVAVNLCRHNPSAMSRIINPKLGDAPMMSKEGKKALSAVQKYLETAESLPPLALSPELTEVCREVNTATFGASDLAQALEDGEGEGDEKDGKKKKEDKGPSKEELEKRELDVTNVLSNLIPEAQKKLKADSVRGVGRCVQGITDELGFTVVVCDICNWVGDKNSERHASISKATKKMGLHCNPLNDTDKIATSIYLEDFGNALI
jgi:hypothetical protein